MLYRVHTLALHGRRTHDCADLRPKEGIHILVGLDPYSRPKLRLHSLSGAVLAEWSAPETPPSHGARRVTTLTPRTTGLCVDRTRSHLRSAHRLARLW